MRIFINEYTKIFAYVLLGIIFSYCSFYFLSNVYHFQEINKKEKINVSQLDSYKKINSNIKQIKDNLDVVDIKNDSINLIHLYSNLNSCVKYLENDSLNILQSKKEYGIKDVEQLRTVVTNDVVNSCLVSNIYYLTYQKDLSLSNYNTEYLKIYIDSITSRLNYVNREISNNSSLYYNTEYARNFTYNKVVDDFDYLLNIYKESSDIILEVSNEFNRRVIADE